MNIPSSVTGIGPGAFWGCSSLALVKIPSSVTTIGFHAFYECTSLASMSIPENVTSIGTDAFQGALCTNASLYSRGSVFCDCNPGDNTCFQLAEDEDGEDSKLSGTMIAVIISVCAVAVVSVVGVWLWRTYKPVAGNTDTGSRM